MFNRNNTQNDVLEIFRIKAHLRSYVKDPIIVADNLLQAAVKKLKKLPYEQNDPTDSVAIELVLEAYRTGYFRYEDLTDTGRKLVKLSKQRHHRHSNSHIRQDQLLRYSYY